MTTKTKTLNVRVTESQYDELEELVERGEYTSKDEYIRELLRNHEAHRVATSRLS